MLNPVFQNGVNPAPFASVSGKPERRFQRRFTPRLILGGDLVHYHRKSYILNRTRVVHFPFAGVVHFPFAANKSQSKMTIQPPLQILSMIEAAIGCRSLISAWIL